MNLVATAKEIVPFIAAGSAERDDKVSIPLEEVELVRKSGILAARVPKRYGGPEASFRDIAEITMSLSEGDPNLAQALSGNFMMDLLLIEGSEDQRQRYFGLVLEGAVFIHALAERGTKFVGDIKTTITPDGDGYRLNGTKFYCTGSLMCDVFLFTGKMENGDLIYAFVPKDRAGLTIVDDWDAMGQRTTASGTTRLENVYVAASELVSVAHWPTTRNYFGASYQIIHAAIDAGIARAALGGRDSVRPKQGATCTGKRRRAACGRSVRTSCCGPDDGPHGDGGGHGPSGSRGIGSGRRRRGWKEHRKQKTWNGSWWNPPSRWQRPRPFPTTFRSGSAKCSTKLEARPRRFESTTSTAIGGMPARTHCTTPWPIGTRLSGTIT